MSNKSYRDNTYTGSKPYIRRFDFIYKVRYYFIWIRHCFLFFKLKIARAEADCGYVRTKTARLYAAPTVTHIIQRLTVKGTSSKAAVTTCLPSLQIATRSSLR
jgi:hypothetical protein